MPKERIYDTTEQFDVEVGWASNRDVQVGVETRSGKSIGELFPGTQFTGFWGSYDREGINKLIRVLRRARDQAYGKDE